MARARPFRLTAPHVPEHAIQKAIAQTLAIEIAPAGKVSRHGVCWWCVDHANFAGEVPGLRIGRGIVAGLPDLFLLWAGDAFFIELKADGGQLSEPQRAVLPALLLAGGRAGVARCVEDVLRLIDAWRIPRNGRTRIAA